MLRWQGEPDKVDKVEDRKRGQPHRPAWDINRALNEFARFRKFTVLHKQGRRSLNSKKA